MHTLLALLDAAFHRSRRRPVPPPPAAAPGHALRTLLEADWQRFMANEPVSEVVRPEILQSWERSRAAGVDPETLPPGARVTPETVAQLTGEAFWLEHAQEVLRAVVASTGLRTNAIAVSASGVVLWRLEEGRPDALIAPDLVGIILREEVSGTSAAALALRTGQPARVFATEHYGRWLHDVSTCAVPIRLPSGALLGVVGMSTAYRDDHPQNLVVLEAAAGEIMQRIRVTRAEQVARATAALIGSANLEEMLGNFTARVQEATGMPRVAVLIRQRDDGQVRVLAGAGPEPTGISDLVLLADAIYPALWEAAAREELLEWVDAARAVLIMPLVIDSHLAVWLHLDSGRPVAFPAGLKEFLRELKPSLAQAVQNALHHREVAEQAAEQESLLEVVRAVTATLHPDTLFIRAVSAVARVFQTHGVVAYLAEGSVLKVQATAGWANDYTEDDASLEESCLAVWSFRHNQAVYVPDVEQDERVNLDRSRKAGARSSAACPIRLNGEPVGVMLVDSRRPHGFTLREVRFLEVAADYLALAFQNARQYAASQQQSRMSETLARIGEALHHSLDLAELMPGTVASIAGALGAGVCAAGLYAADGRSFASLWCSAPVPGLDEPWPDSAQPLAAAFHRREPTVLQAASLPSGAPVRVWMEGEGHPNAAIVPVCRGETALGALLWFAPARVDNAAVEFLVAAAGQLAGAMHNASQYQHARLAADRRAAMHRISDLMVQATEEEPLLLAVVDEIQRVFPEALPIVSLLDETGEWLIDLGTGERWAYGLSLGGYALEQGRLVCFPDLADCPFMTRELIDQSGLPAGIGMPLATAQRRYGALMLFYPEPYPWPPDILEFIETVGYSLSAGLDSLYHRKVAVAEAGRRAALLDLVNRMVDQDLQVEEICRVLLHQVARYLKTVAWAAVWMPDGAEGSLRVRAVLDPGMAAGGAGNAGAGPLITRALQTGRVVETAEAGRRLLAAPIVAGGEPIGVIFVEAHALEASDEVIEFLAAAGRQAGAIIRAAELHQQVQRMAVTDGLTGLYNRQYFDRWYTERYQSLDGSSGPFAVVMIDVDQFKQINDEHGHLVGDQVLREVGRTLQQCLAEGQLAARYGGEEFVLVLPGAGTEAAVRLVEEVRQRLRSLGGTPITISAGVAEWRGEPGVDPLRVADGRLLEAKQAGRDRICA